MRQDTLDKAQALRSLIDRYKHELQRIESFPTPTPGDVCERRLQQREPLYIPAGMMSVQAITHIKEIACADLNQLLSSWQDNFDRL